MKQKRKLVIFLACTRSRRTAAVYLSFPAACDTNERLRMKPPEQRHAQTTMKQEFSNKAQPLPPAFYDVAAGRQVHRVHSAEQRGVQQLLSQLAQNPGVVEHGLNGVVEGNAAAPEPLCNSEVQYKKAVVLSGLGAVQPFPESGTPERGMRGWNVGGAALRYIESSVA